MASLREIENHLNIEVLDKKLRNGRKYQHKNKYYRYDDFYIVSLTQGKFMIIDNDRKNRKLLRKYCWRVHSKTRYAVTGETTKGFHQLLLKYGNGLVADHINRCRFDNRFENLRIVTYQENNRNTTLHPHPSSPDLLFPSQTVSFPPAVPLYIYTHTHIYICIHIYIYIYIYLVRPKNCLAVFSSFPLSCFEPKWIQFLQFFTSFSKLEEK